MKGSSMYKISVPFMNKTIHKGNREQYLALIKKAGASRIFLALEENVIPDTLKENIEFFKAHGYEVGVWFNTTGHGFVFDHLVFQEEEAKFQQMVNVKGQQVQQANCPFDKKFLKFISNFVAEVAKLGPDIVMLDDDFRVSQHGPDFCCACPLHLQRMSEILGEEVTVEKMRPYVLTGKANKYRDAWMQAQRESLIGLAKAIRAKVDEKTPEVLVCNCTAMAPWNADDVDMVEIAHILAGKNKPILRLTGAPYWATGVRRTNPLITTFEIARMLVSFVKDKGIELMSEGDVYPRPRYNCPASYLELYDAVTRADGGYDGILKYMFDYVAGPDFETGYLAMHEENQVFYEKLQEAFKGGANAGVRIMVKPHTMKGADHDLSAPMLRSPVPIDGTMLGQCGIPTIYRGKGVCNSLFGETARTIDLSELENGTILDAVSAVILTERGVDVGLSGAWKMRAQSIGLIRTNNPECGAVITNGKVNVLETALKKEAEPVLFSVDGNGATPFAYRYENANGERFLVFLFDGASVHNLPLSFAVSGLLKNYATQEVLIETIPWLGGKAVPAYCKGNPELYVMCKEDAGTKSVALFNTFADRVMNPVVVLDKAYTHIEGIGCDAKIEGNKVTLTSKLAAYEMAAFKVW